MSIQTKKNDDFPSGTSWGFKDPAGNTLKVEGKHVNFTSASGVVVDIDANGKLSISAPSDIDITAPTVNIKGDVHTTGSLTNNGVNVGSTHKHIGVQTGGGTSGIPV
jgi:phage baseplate assembly protein gpV